MKTKKILTMISSVVMAATLGLSALAGCNKDEGGHEHSYQEIELEPATCMQAGKRTLKCACGDIKEEVLPVDPDAHDYGDWNITAYPDENNKGTATNVCSLNNAHKATVTLPIITKEGTGYASSPITKAPTSISTGVRHFVYVQGNVSVEFDITLPKRDIENMEDAIIYGTSLHSLIRESSGRFASGNPYDPRLDKDSELYDPNYSITINTFSNYYGTTENGDEFTHVKTSDRKEEFWYSLDDKGAPFGVYSAVNHVLTNPLDETNGILQNPLGPDEVDEEGNPLDPNYKPEYLPKDPDYVPIYEDVPVDPRLAAGTTADNLKGYGYASGGGMRRTYGAEDTLLTYYQAAVGVGSIKYKYEFDELPEGGFAGNFSFSRMEDAFFCRYNVEFTMYENYVIKTLKVETKIIRLWMLANTYEGGDTAGEIIRAADGDIIFSEIYPLVEGEEQYETETGEDGKEHIVVNGVKTAPDGTILKVGGKEIKRPVPKDWKQGDWNFYYEKGDHIYAVNDNGEVYDTGETYAFDHEFIAVRFLEFDSQVLKTDDNNVETNPYPAEDMYVRSFDVKFGGKVIAEDETVEIESNVVNEFEITNVLPKGDVNLAYDPLNVYLVTPTGEIQLTYDINQNAYHILGYFNGENNRVRIMAQNSGNFEIILRSLSGSYEKTLKINVLKGAPSKLLSEVYTYSDAGGIVKYTWTEFDESNTGNFVTMYVGQKLYVRTAALESEASFADTSYTSSVSNTYSSYVILKDKQSVGGGEATEITAVKATGNGTMRVYLDSTRSSDVSASIRIKILDAPSVEDMFTGEYIGRFNYIKMVSTDRNPSYADVSITFNPVAEDKTSGTISINVTRDKLSATCVYNYSYDKETYALTCEWESGRGNDDNDETFRFVITLNEVFKVSITHPTGYPGREETIVLSRPQS